MSELGEHLCSGADLSPHCHSSSSSSSAAPAVSVQQHQERLAWCMVVE